MTLLTTLLKKYPIRLTSYPFKFRKFYQLTELDSILLDLLKVREDEAGYEELATTLGFSIVEDPDRHHFADSAEESLYLDFLNQLVRYHLIEITQDSDERRLVRTTTWGDTARKEGRKSLFYNGTISLPEHHRIKLSQRQNVEFPFSKFKVFAVLKGSCECNPFPVEEIQGSAEDPLLLLAANTIKADDFDESIEIHSVSDKPVGYDEDILSLELQLMSLKDEFFLNTQLNGVAAPEFDRLLDLAENTVFYENYLLEAGCQFYLESAVTLKATVLAEFTPYVNWLDVLSDKRLLWDTELLKLLSEKEIASQEIWSAIIDSAPHEFIIEHLQEYRELWDWVKLSETFSPEVIIQKVNAFPWDIDVFVSRLNEKLSEALLKTLDDKNKITDWTAVTKKVSEAFLENHIDQYPFDIHLLTRLHSEKQGELIIMHGNLPWDWAFIQQQWPLERIANNINRIAPRLNVAAILVRVLKNQQDLEELLNTDSLMQFVRGSAQDSHFRIGVKDEVILSFPVLNLLSELKMLFWGFENIPGVEANPNLHWTKNIFDSFGSNVKSQAGFANVSRTIPSLDIVASEDDFPWEFNVISQREDLEWSFEFIEEFSDRLNPDFLLSSVPKSIFVHQLTFFIKWYSEHDYTDELLSYVSASFTVEDIFKCSEQLIEHNFNVDWKQVLQSTEKDFLPSLAKHIHSESDPVPNLQELWTGLSEFCNLDFIVDFPDLPWNWQLITDERLEEPQLLAPDFQHTYAAYLYWPSIIDSHYEVSELDSVEKLVELGSLLNKAHENTRTESWSCITSKLPQHMLLRLLAETSGLQQVKWDWDYISSLDKLSISQEFLSTYKNNLNWSRFSKNLSLGSFFRYDKSAYHNTEDWFTRCMEYLENYKEFWDFKALSHIDNLTWDAKIISKFKNLWDWKVLSSKSSLLVARNKDLNKYEYLIGRLQKFADQVDWAILSERYEVLLPGKLLEKQINKPWNWGALSSHPNLDIDKAFLTKHEDLPWDFKALTNHKKLKLDKDLLLRLPLKDWDFKTISSKAWVDNDLLNMFRGRDWDWRAVVNNHNLIPDLNLLKLLVDSNEVEWNRVLQNSNLHITTETLKLLVIEGKMDKSSWYLLSKHPNLQFSKENSHLLSLYKDQWSWNILTRRGLIDLHNPAILRKYQIYLDWNEVSQSEHFDPTDDAVLTEFGELLDWQTLTERISFNEARIENFKDFLHWSSLSKSHKINFTPYLIEAYRTYWDYYYLKDNISLSYEAKNYVEKLIEQMPQLGLYFKLKAQHHTWSGYIYHFTHISNAEQVLKTRKILSRKKASGFSDAAGSVVGRRHTAHEFARFYFRPQTPTQFYNECLGSDHELNNYEQAVKLGLPKCPVPIFFRFNLQEVLLKMPEKCFMSNGNMQTNWAQVQPVTEMLPRFNFRDIYSTVGATSDGDWKTYINYSQQEFLIKEEFDFSGLRDYSIIVGSNQDRENLLHRFNSDLGIQARIQTEDETHAIFHNENKRLSYSYEHNVLRLAADYLGNGLVAGEFFVEFEAPNNFELLSGQVSETTDQGIYAYPGLELRISTETFFKVHFIDHVTDKRWEIFRRHN